MINWELLYIIIFISLPLIVLFLLTHLSGWHKLAEKYGYQATFSGKKFSMCTGFVGMVRYKNCLTIGVSQEGLYLNVFFVFRLGYPPLLIPWSDISRFEEKKQWWLTYYLLDVGYPKLTSLKLPARIFTTHPEILERLKRIYSPSP